MGRWQSGQLQRTVNPPGQPYEGSNPSLPKDLLSLSCMKQSTRQRYEDGLKQLTLSRTIEKRSWLEHMKRAKELNQVL